MKYKVVVLGSQESEVSIQETMPNQIVLHIYEKRYINYQWEKALLQEAKVFINLSPCSLITDIFASQLKQTGYINKYISLIESF